MKKYYYYVLTVPLLLFIASPVLAEEINYATIDFIEEKNISVRYEGPSTDSYFLCSLQTTECSPSEERANSIPEILGKQNYLTSPDGDYGVVTLGHSNPLYILYNISGNTPKFKTLIPYQGSLSRILFSPSSKQVFFFGSNGEIFRYDIDSHQSKKVTTSQSEFPQRIISPNGRYVSAYSYTNSAHLIWDVNSGTEISVPGESPSYVEFSENEQYAAFTNTEETGFDSLYLLNLQSSPSKPELIFNEKFTVIDYIFLGNEIYYVSNEDGPYEWSLYRYDPETEEKEKISENISYADHIRRVNNHLFFLVIEDKNTDVAIYDPGSNKTSVFRPIEASPAPSAVQRQVIKHNNTYGALIEPENANEEALFIWLHGGPQRQTSPAYHSYLSYAVYDELLDRLVEGGATVLKLDYTGSFGYGKDFIEDLEKNVGDVDVEDVLKMAEKLTDEKNFDRVYLIGNSYGAYLSMRTLVEKPEAFDGSIGINGVYDWETLLSRIPSSPLRSLFGGLPSEDNSPVYRTADIVRKLDELGKNDQILLVLGEKDSAVPVWQTTDFVSALDHEDVDFELLSFPNENHVLTSRDTLDKLCKKVTDWANLDSEVCEN